ncbi:7402_t:CDS:1, partial [Gigaspora rosea]
VSCNVIMRPFSFTWSIDIDKNNGSLVGTGGLLYITDLLQCD